MPIDASRFLQNGTVTLVKLATEVTDRLLTSEQESALDAIGANAIVYTADATINPLAAVLDSGNKAGLMIPADKSKLNSLLTVQVGAQDPAGNNNAKFLGIDFNAGFTVTRVGNLAKVTINPASGAILGVQAGDGLNVDNSNAVSPKLFALLTPTEAGAGGLKFTTPQSGNKTIGLDFAANNAATAGKAVESTDSRLWAKVKSFSSGSAALDVDSSLDNGQGDVIIDLVLAANNVATAGLPVDSTDDRLTKLAKKLIAATGITVSGSLGNGQGDVTVGLDLAADGTAVSGKAMASTDSRLLALVRTLVSGVAGITVTNSGPQGGPLDLSLGLSFGTVASPVVGKPIQSNDPGLTDRVHSVLSGTAGVSLSGAQGDVTIGLVFDNAGGSAVKPVAGNDSRFTTLVKSAVAGDGIAVSAAQGDVTFSLDEDYLASGANDDNHPGLMSVADKDKLDGLSDPVTSHSDLDDLTADDHPQYLKVDASNRSLLADLVPKAATTVYLGAAGTPFSGVFSSFYKGASGAAASFPDGINLGGSLLKDVRLEVFLDNAVPAFSAGRLVYTSDTGKLLWGSPTLGAWVNLREIPVASVTGHGTAADVHVTADEKAALDGTGTPSGSNKFVTADHTGLLSSDDRTKFASLFKVYNLSSALIGPFTTLRLSGGVSSIAADGTDPNIVNIAISSGAISAVQAGNATILASTSSGTASVSVRLMPGLVVGASGVQLDLNSTLEIDGNSKLGAKIGTASGTVCAGNDARLSDARPLLEDDQETLDGALQRAGGTMTGAINFGLFAATNFVLAAPGSLPSAVSPGGRLLYFGNTLYLDNGTSVINVLSRSSHSGTQALSTISDHGDSGTVHLSAGEKAALVGTVGTPGSSNKFVTNSDTRLPTAAEVLRLSNLLTIQKDGQTVAGGVVTGVNFTGDGIDTVSIAGTGDTAKATVTVKTGISSISKDDIPDDAESEDSITGPTSIQVVGSGVNLYSSDDNPGLAILEFTGAAPITNASLDGDGTSGDPLRVVFSSDGTTTPAAVDNTDSRLSGNAKLASTNAFTGKNSFADLSTFKMPLSGPTAFFGRTAFGGGGGDSDGFLTIGTSQQASAYVTALEWNRASTVLPYWDLTVINNESSRFSTDTFRLRRTPLPVTGLPAVDILRSDQSGNLYIGPGSTGMVWGTSGTIGYYVNAGSKYLPVIQFNAATKRWEYTVGGDNTSNPVNPPVPSKIIEPRALANNGLVTSDIADSGAGEYRQFSIAYATSGDSASLLPTRSDDKRLKVVDVNTTGQGATNPTSIPGLMSVADKNNLTTLVNITLIAASPTVKGISYLTTSAAAATNPTANRWGGLAYDPRRLRVVAFGGQDESGDLVDRLVWEWNGFTWIDVSPRNPNGSLKDGPAARTGMAFVYIPDRKRILMHGGYVLDGQDLVPTSEMWEWDGTAWYSLQMPNSPTPPPAATLEAAGHACVYDEIRKVVVAYLTEKNDENEDVSKVYELSWDGKNWTWTDKTPGSSPPPRLKASMAYDVSGAKTILFGGERLDVPGTHYSDTWTWNGTAWTEVVAAGPSSRSSMTMAYYPATGKVVGFGGSDIADRNDTWRFTTSSGTWAEQTFSTGLPAVRSLARLVYHPARGSLVLFGGCTDQTVWEYRGTSWTQVTAAVAAVAVSDGDPRIATAFPPPHDHSDDGYGGGSIRLPETGTLLIPKGNAPDDPREIIEVAGGDLQYKDSSGVVRTLVSLPSTSALLAATAEKNGIVYLSENPTPEPIPSARYQASGAYYGRTARATVFGGQSFAGVFNKETWEWTGTRWVRKTAVLESDSNFKARAGHVVVADTTRNKLFMHAGRYGQTAGQMLSDGYEWDGTNWATVSFVSTSPFPPARFGHAMVYDSVRQRVILFGGWDAVTGDPYDDTWEFDGTNWAQIAIPGTAGVARPYARGNHSMAYDATRQRVILFGGSTSEDVATPGEISNGRNDTWEYNPSAGTWSEKQALANPGVRNPDRATRTSMVYDAARNKVLLWGGEWYNGNTFEYWSWEGLYSWNSGTNTWDVVNEGVTQPIHGAACQMSYDSTAQKVILYGGYRWTLSMGSPVKEYSTKTWEWNGTAWTEKTPVANPGNRAGCKMVYDSVRSVTTLFGGLNDGNGNATWEWNGTNWTERSLAGDLPTSRSGAALAFDAQRQKEVLFGGWTNVGTGLNDTWTFNGTAWTLLIFYPPPVTRELFGMAYDPSRDKVILFGGRIVDSGTGNEVLNGSTWEYDPATRRWLNLTVTTPPSARVNQAMAYFPELSKVVLFGGTTAGGAQGDTYVYDGASKTWANPAANGPVLTSPVLTYDPVKKVLVLTGNDGSSSETWEWTGSGSWAQVTIAAAKNVSARDYPVAIVDTPRNRVVLFGGKTASAGLQDTWIWNGTDWAKRRKGEDIADVQSTSPIDNDPRMDDARMPLEHDHSTAATGGITLKLPTNGVLLMPSGADPTENRGISESTATGKPLKYKDSVGTVHPIPYTDGAVPFGSSLSDAAQGFQRGVLIDWKLKVPVFDIGTNSAGQAATAGDIWYSKAIKNLQFADDTGTPVIRTVGTVTSVTPGAGILRADGGDPAAPITSTGELEIDFTVVAAASHNHDGTYGRLAAINTWALLQTFTTGVAATAFEIGSGDIQWHAGTSRVRFSHDGTNFYPFMEPLAGNGISRSVSADGGGATLSVDQSFSPTWGGNHTFSNQVVQSQAPVNADHLTTKTYVDTLVAATSNVYATPVADLTALKAIAPASRQDRQIRLVDSTGGLYRFQAGDATAANEPDIVVPDDEATVAGRWMRVQGYTQSHNSLTSLQGGTTNEFYHLTSAQSAKAPNLLQLISIYKDGVQVGTTAQFQKINFTGNGLGTVAADGGDTAQINVQIIGAVTSVDEDTGEQAIVVNPTTGAVKVSLLKQAPLATDGSGLKLNSTAAFKLTSGSLDLDFGTVAAGRAAESDKVLYKDGSTTATAQIPFAQGLSVADTKKLQLPLNTATPANQNIWIDDSVVADGEVRFKDKNGNVRRLAINTGAGGAGTLNQVSLGATDVNGPTQLKFASANTDPEGATYALAESPAGTALITLTAIKKVITNATLSGDGLTATALGINLGNANTWSALQTLSSGAIVGTRLGLPSGGTPANNGDIKEDSGYLEYKLADGSAVKTILFQENLTLTDASWPVGWDADGSGNPTSGATAGKTTIEVRNLPADLTTLSQLTISIEQSIDHANDFNNNLWLSVAPYAIDRRAGQTGISGSTLTIVVRHAGSALAANATDGPFFRYTVRRK